MGFFKDMRQLEKIGKEQSKNKDVAGTMAMAHQRMEASQELLAEQTKIANAQATGVPATVTITGLRELPDDGTSMGRCDMDLTVIVHGLPPYPLTTKGYAAQVKFALTRPSPTLAAKVDPSDPSAIALDLATPVM
jgi:hypothetical protein